MLTINDLGDIKTFEAGNQQRRDFTEEQKDIIINACLNLPEGVTLKQQLEELDLAHGVYYSWLKAKNKKEQWTVPTLIEMLPDGDKLTLATLQAFYSAFGDNINTFLNQKYEEFLTLDIVGKIASKINDDNLESIAAAVNISKEDLNSYINREIDDLPYKTVTKLLETLNIE